MINAIAILLSGSIWLWVVLKKDRYEKEPLFKLLKVAVLGGLISAIPAGMFNAWVGGWLGFDPETDSDMQGMLVFYGFVGINEEFWKALAAIWLIAKHKEFNEPVDGIIYAMTVALGFAVLENFEYITQYGLGVLVGRHFVSMPAHIAFAMCWGYGLALAKFKFPERNVWRVIFPYLLFAAILHGLFDIFASADSTVALMLVIALYVYGGKRINTLLLHSPFRPEGHCVKCLTNNAEGSSFCRKCGFDMRMDKSLFAEKAQYFENKQCGHCHAVNIPAAQYCKQCGEQLPKTNSCYACSKALPDSAQFCPQCGVTVLSAR
jgi:RsiW-degrading membrane proteinase PrsW (M82 family)/ribosomal protein L40E